MRYALIVGLGLLLAGCAGMGNQETARTDPARPRSGWGITPTITVIGARSDPRLPLVDEAVAYWNDSLAGIGSGFRLPAAQHIVQPVPEEALQRMSNGVLNQPRSMEVPQALSDLPGDLTILLGDSEFVSFARFIAPDKRLVGIRNMVSAPLNLPNVARNVIAHELGHAIGLGHNADPTMLMCGRPAPCRPDSYWSKEPRMFPLSDDDKQQLLRMYPPAWKPRAP